MVALLSQCFDQCSNSSSDNNNNNNNINNNNNDLKIPEVSPVRNVSDQNVPTGNIPTGQDILQQQFKELKEYTRHLEKEVEEYRKYIEERFNNINNQQFNVLEGFSNSNSSGSNESKDMNDIIVYLMTCIFVLLLVDYIFKMGKNSY
tara:strand:+ start:103 stop:543 length:441 start_codon:yes stop_codon:yes gene_type:complete